MGIADAKALWGRKTAVASLKHLGKALLYVQMIQRGTGKNSTV